MLYLYSYSCHNIIRYGEIMYISEHTIKKILKEAGATRVSADACTELQKYINRSAFNIAQKAVRLSKHAKRKTVDATDVKLACT